MNDDRMQQLPTEDSLKQLPIEQLVTLIVQQQKVIVMLQQEVERLRVSAGLDSQTSSKPPSSDLLKKPTKAKPKSETSQEKKPKRKPGGQPGHQGKTRKGFNRIDRIQVLRPSECSYCGSRELETEPVNVWLSQVAQLVERQARSGGVPAPTVPMSSLWARNSGSMACTSNTRSRFGCWLTSIIRLALETANISDYQVWATTFKVRVQQAVQQFLPIAGYEAGKILRSLR